MFHFSFANLWKRSTLPLLPYALLWSVDFLSMPATDRWILQATSFIWQSVYTASVSYMCHYSELCLVTRFYHFRQLWAEGVPRLFDKCVRQALEQGPGSSAAQACLPPTIQMHSFCGQHEDCFISPSMVKDQATKAALTESMRRRCVGTHIVWRYLVNAAGLKPDIKFCVEVLRTKLLLIAIISRTLVWSCVVLCVCNCVRALQAESRASCFRCWYMHLFHKHFLDPQ